jgi:hypothetical protein
MLFYDGKKEIKKTENKTFHLGNNCQSNFTLVNPVLFSLRQYY